MKLRSGGPAAALILALGRASSFAAPPDLNAARAFMDAGDYERAYAETSRALASSPGDEAALALRARVEALGGTRLERWLMLSDAERRGDRLEEGRLRLAIGDAEGAARVLAGAPDGGERRLLLARALRDREPEKALALARRTLGAEARRLAGELLLDLGDEEGARDELAVALALDPAGLETLRAAADAWRTDEERSRALAARADAAARAAPAWRRGSSLRFAARLRLELGDRGKAAALLDEALALEPDDLEALRLLAEARPGAAARARRAAKPAPVARTAAEADAFERAIPGLPLWQRADAYYAAALARRALGDDVRAKRLVRRAEEAEPGAPRTVRLLAAIAPEDPDVALDLKEANEAADEARAALLRPR